MMMRPQTERAWNWLLVGLALLAASSSGCGGKKEGGKSLTAQYQAALKIPGADARGQRLLEIGRRQIAAGDQAGADASLASAAQAAEQIDAPSGRASLLARIAHEEAKRGERNDAKELLKKARDAYLNIDLIEARIPLVAQAAVTHGAYLDSVDLARADLKEAEAWIDQIPAVKDQVAAGLDLAVAYHQIDENSPNATRLAALAAQEAGSLENLRHRADALALAAHAHHQMNDKATAAALLDDAQANAEQIREDLSRAYAFINLAVVASHLGDKDQALKLMGKAQSLTSKVDSSMRENLKKDIQRAKAKL